MTLWDWLRLEEIFASIFQQKCERRMESEHPQPSGQKKKPLVKYLIGGGVLLIFIFITWFPWVIFALGSTVDLPSGDFVNSQPMYDMSVQSNAIDK
jgi:hypothetical protein